MRSALLALLLLAGAPLPFIETAPSLEEDAVVEVSKPVRRESRVERLKREIAPEAPSVPPRLSLDAPVRPDAPHEPSPQFPRPPPLS